MTIINHLIKDALDEATVRKVVRPLGTHIAVVVPEPLYVGFTVPQDGAVFSSLFVSTSPLKEDIHPRDMTTSTVGRIGLTPTPAKLDSPLTLNWTPLARKVRSANNEERRREIEAEIARLRNELAGL